MDAELRISHSLVWCPGRSLCFQDTLDAAHSDAENMVAENLQKKADYVKKLETFFKAIDEFGDGLITEARLKDILNNPKVAAYFATLEVDVLLGNKKALCTCPGLL